MEEPFNKGPFYKENNIHSLILQSWEVVCWIFVVFYKLPKLIAHNISDVVFHLLVLIS